MAEPHEQDLFDEEGHIDYDKVVEQVNNKLKELLHSCLDECFLLAKDTAFRHEMAETNNKICDEAFDALLSRQQVVASECYVEIESRFYSSASAITRAQIQGHGEVRTMETDLIELSLAVDNLIKHSEERHNEALEELEFRLQELSYFAHNEFNMHCMHPQDFYPLFQNAIAPLNISADGKIFLCRLLYQQVSPKLGSFYAQLNQLLIAMDILPSAESINNAKTVNSTMEETTGAENSDALDSSVTRMSTGQFFSPVEQELRDQGKTKSPDSMQRPSPQGLGRNYAETQGAKTSKEFEEATTDVYGSERTGLDQDTVSLILQPYSPGSSSDSSPDQRRQLVQALSSVQRVEIASDAIFKAEQIKIAVRRILHEEGVLDAVEIVNNEAKVIDFVSNIFQLILDDDALCDAIKLLLAKLQISLIKLALIDFTLFQNPKHPARRLLNKLTSMGIGITEKEELLFDKLASVVHLVIENFETDVKVFELALAEVQNLDISNLEQALEAEGEAQHKAKLKVKRSTAKRIVIHTINRYLQDRELPNQMLEFCLKCWAPHMGIIFMENGKKSKAWRASVRTLRRVLEVSQGIHSLLEVCQYIKQPEEFFNYIRGELEYLANKKQEFNVIIGDAEAWYLTYLHEIGQKQSEQTSATKTLDNFIHLFKNLSKPEKPTPISETLIAEKSKIQTIIEPENETSVEIKASDIYKEQLSDEDSAKQSIENETLQVTQEKTAGITEENDPEEVTNATLDDLPENIVPGAWLEIYQGASNAKRRLKFSTTLEETGRLLFTDRSGDYSLEIDIQTFMNDLNAWRTRLISENNRFDLALSSVINNIRDSQS